MSSADKQQIKRYGSSGVHTVEGNVSGSLAAQLAKESSKAELAFLKEKEAIQQSSSSSTNVRTFVQDRFVTKKDSKKRSIINTNAIIDEEAEFKRRTVGLQSAAEFKHKREHIKTLVEKEAAEKVSQKKKRKKKPKAAANAGPLSFTLTDDDDEDNVRVKKNPAVNTSFLPDPEREKQEASLRKKLETEWEKSQKLLKNSFINVEYSYWNGTGHRKTIKIMQKTLISEFLQSARTKLKIEFPELRGTCEKDLMYVRNDSIIPHNLSFYDLINGDNNDDKNESSFVGKVVEKKWYDANKHLYPASRWQNVSI